VVKFGKGIFHPIESASWPEFVVGSVIAGLLLGIGMAIGNNLVNRFAPAYLRAPATHYDFDG